MEPHPIDRWVTFPSVPEWCEECEGSIQGPVITQTMTPQHTVKATSPLIKEVQGSLMAKSVPRCESS